MLGIIICGGSEQKRSSEKDLIYRILPSYNIDYNVYEFSGLCEKLNDIINDNNMKKIYVINVKDDKCLRIISLIRKKEPYSIIILISNSNKYHYDISNNKLMVLDFIKRTNFVSEFTNDLNYAINLICEHQVFSFKYNRNVYVIPYNRINYIEKESSIKRCIIHTIDGSYYIVNSLNKISDVLPREFFRAHQSCIINKNNIKKINLTRNKIIFNNGDTTSLLSNIVKKNINKYVDIC